MAQPKEEQKKMLKVTTEAGVVLNISDLKNVDCYTDSIVEGQCIALMIKAGDKVFLGHVFPNGATTDLESRAEQYLTKVINILGAQKDSLLDITIVANVPMNQKAHDLRDAFLKSSLKLKGYGKYIIQKNTDKCWVNQVLFANNLDGSKYSTPETSGKVIYTTGSTVSQVVAPYIKGVVINNFYFNPNEFTFHEESGGTHNINIPSVRKPPIGWDSERLLSSDNYKRLSGKDYLGSTDLCNEVLNELVMDSNFDAELNENDKIAMCGHLMSAITTRRQAKSGGIVTYSPEIIESIVNAAKQSWKQAKITALSSTSLLTTISTTTITASPAPLPPKQPPQQGNLSSTIRNFATTMAEKILGGQINANSVSIYDLLKPKIDSEKQLVKFKQDYNELEDKYKCDLGKVKEFITTWEMKGEAERKDDKKGPPPPPSADVSAILTLTEQIDNSMLLATIREHLKNIPKEIRDEVNRIAGEHFSKAKVSGRVLKLSDMRDIITKTAEEMQSKTKVIEQKEARVEPLEVETSHTFS